MASVASSPVGGRPPCRGPSRRRARRPARPQLADHVGGRAVGGHLAEPRERRAAGDDDRAAPPAPGPARPASSPPRKARVTPLASSWRLHEHQTRGQHGGRGGEDHEPPCGRGMPQQPRVERLHRACAPASVAESARTPWRGPSLRWATPVGAGMSVGPMRRRNTQYVQAW